MQNTAQATSDLGAEQLSGQQGSEHRTTEVHPEVCVQKTILLGSQLSTGIRMSCDKHGPFFPPALKSQTRLSDGKAQS